MDNSVFRHKSLGFCLPLSVFLTGCATSGIPQDQIYRLYGMQESLAPYSTDGVFQNFTEDNGNLAHIWLDTDAQMHKGKSRAGVQAWVERPDNEAPFLRVSYNRQGYGANLTIAAKDNRPEQVDDDDTLVITMRSESNTCVGVRLQEADGEVWLYGKETIDYVQQCVDGGNEWTALEIPIGDTQWVQFPYNGNLHLGNGVREKELITSVSLEIGQKGQWYLAPGEGTLDIQSIMVR